MDLGFCPVGVGSAADPIFLAKLAVAAENAGLSTLWAGCHPFMVDEPSRPYPYSPDGKPHVPIGLPVLDAFAALTFVAAITSRIRLGTGVYVAPLEHPAALAQRVATVDRLSNGRFNLGIGVGWQKEEFDVLKVAYERRGAITDESIEALKVLWSTDLSAFSGTFFQFEKIRSFPKSMQQPHPPIIIGGNSDAALRRVARYGDGWYGANLGLEATAKSIDRLRPLVEQAGRDLSDLHLYVLYPHYFPNTLSDDELAEDLAAYEAMGVREVVVSFLHEDPQRLEDELARLGSEYLGTTMEDA